jgi:hypothetical protein
VTWVHANILLVQILGESPVTRGGIYRRQWCGPGNWGTFQRGQELLSPGIGEYHLDYRLLSFPVCTPLNFPHLKKFGYTCEVSRVWEWRNGVAFVPSDGSVGFCSGEPGWDQRYSCAHDEEKVHVHDLGWI